MCQGVRRTPRSKLFLMVKLTFFFLMSALLEIHATANAQVKAVTLDVKNMPLKEVFNELKKQTELDFFYSNEELNMNSQVTIQVRNADLRDVLTRILGRGYQVEIMKGMVIIKPATAVDSVKMKSIKLRGSVVDETRVPLPGVTVKIKNSIIGTATDRNGKFSLEVPEMKNLVLEFSFVGMKTQEVKYTGQDSLYVVMKENSQEMDEVVVTGYQAIRKSDVVGSMVTVKASDIMMPAYTSIDQMLQGQVAGMIVMNTSARVGTTPKITIRGQSTLLGNTDPLWVVDGIIQSDPLPFDISTSMTEDLTTMLGNQISWLNPNDIETITVLKDASATAVYGAKASNGVIVITTKKGGKDGRVSVNYSHSSSLRLRSHYSDFKLMNSQERIEFAQNAFAAGLKYQKTPPADRSTYEGLLVMYMERQITEDEFSKEVKKLETGNTDWLDLLTRNSYSHSHNLSINGGSEKISYNASVSYSDSKGTEIGNDSRKMSGRLSLNAQPHKNIVVGMTFTGSSTKTDGYGPGVNPLQYATTTSRSIRAFDDAGEYSYYKKLSSYGYIPQPAYLGYNILKEIESTSSENRIDNLSASLNFNWKILDWLEYQFVGGYDYSKTYNETYASEESFYIANKYRGYLYGTVVPNSPEYNSAVLPYGGELLTSDGETRGYDIQNKLLFNKTFNDVHRVNVMAGIQVRSTENINRSSTVWGYSAERGETVTPPTHPDDFEALNGLPLLSNSSWGIFSGMYNGSGWRNNSRTDNYFSVFLTAAYSYTNRYVFNFSMRTDASNRFGQDHNKRFDPTYSLGVSWRMAEESFIRDNIAWLNQLNLRFSYGLQGNVVNSISPDLILSRRGIMSPWNEEVSAISSLPNPYLKYEKTESYNIGLDLQLFKGITMVLEYYDRETNAITPQTVPLENGVQNLSVNGGMIHNKGIEYTVNFTPFSTKNFAWTVGLNASKNWNDVKSTLNASPSQLRNAYLEGDNNYIKKGYPINGFWSFSFAGLNPENGVPTFNKLDLEEYNGDPAEYLVYSGEKEPYFTGGLNTRLRYKSFSVGANFSLLLGKKMRLQNPYESILNGMADPDVNLSSDLTKAWLKPGDEEFTNMPGLPVSDAYRTLVKLPDGWTMSPMSMWNLSDVRVVDASFLRCNQITLGWTASRNICKKLGINSLTVNGTINNVFVIASKKLNGFDPELNGEEVQPKIFSLGCSIGF